MFVYSVVRAAKATNKVQGGFEPPSLDSKSRVLTVTPLDQSKDFKCGRLCIGAAQTNTPTPMGFEPMRAKPIGFRVQLLNHSDTVSNGYSHTITAITNKRTAIEIEK